MNNVVFDNENTHYQTSPLRQPKGLAGMLIKWGLVKNNKQANLCLIIFFLVMLSIMFFLMNAGDENLNKNLVDPATVDQTLEPDYVNQ